MADRYCMHNQLMNDFIDENFEGIRAPFTAGFELTAKCNLIAGSLLRKAR